MAERVQWWGLSALCLALLSGSVLVTSDAPQALHSFGTRPPSPVPTPPAPTPPASSVAPALSRDAARPVVFSIPRLRLRADVRAVGVDREGAVSIPAKAADVGWYRFGAAPGDPIGSAVLVGHVDSRDGSLGALAALYKVREGDRAQVRRADGYTVHYRITTRQAIPKRRLPASEIFRRDGPAVLTLVTCAPPYDRPHGGYQSNLVVTAVPLGR